MIILAKPVLASYHLHPMTEAERAQGQVDESLDGLFKSTTTIIEQLSCTPRQIFGAQLENCRDKTDFPQLRNEIAEIRRRAMHKLREEEDMFPGGMT